MIKKHLIVAIAILFASTYKLTAQYSLSIIEPNAPCLPAEFTFQVITQSSFGAVQIDFGDGSPDAVIYNTDPFYYSYEIPGTYPVNVLFYDEFFNLMDNQVYSINVMNYFSHLVFSNAQSSNLIGSPINFSFSTNESNVSISWDFGDGNTSSDTNPAHAYSVAGSYTVTATIQSPACGTLTRTLTVNVIDATLTIDIPVNCAPATVHFTINSNDPAVQFYSFAGGNGFQTGITTSNTTPIIYSNPGNNVVQIGLYDASQNPIAFISQTFILDGDDYTITTNMLNNLLSLNELTEFNWFANNATTPPSPSSATWNFGNAVTSNDVSPVYAYPNSGTYNVQVEYMQSCGTLANESMTVIVADVNIAFTPAIDCAPTSMTFDYLGTDDAEIFAWFVLDSMGMTVYQSGATSDNFLNYTFNTPGPQFVAVQAFDVFTTLIGTKIVEVYINGPTSSTLEVSTCDNQYTWTDGNTYSTSGTYTQQLTNAAGCDSTATLQLTFLPSYQTSESQTACSSFLWSENGQTYNASGNYSVVFTNQFGCDSTIILELIIIEPTTGTVSVSACEEHIENGITYTQSGVYTQTLTNVAGCDSTLILDITINDPNNLNSSVTACDQFTWNGTTYNSSGIYTYEETVGCVGTYTLDLTIVEPYYGSLEETACDEFTWNEVTYTLSGTYIFTGTTVDGCDSIVVLDLIIHESPIAEITVTNGFELTASTGDSYEWLDCDNGYAVIANETNQVFMAPNGNYAVRVTTNGCSDISECVFVENSTVSTFENNKKQIMIYPNPSSDIVTVEGLEDFSSVAIYDALGKLVCTYNLDAADSLSVNVSGFEGGMYFVKISNQQTAITKRLMVK